MRSTVAPARLQSKAHGWWPIYWTTNTVNCTVNVSNFWDHHHHHCKIVWIVFRNLIICPQPWLVRVLSVKDFARDRVLNIVNSSRTAMWMRRRSPPSSMLDAPHHLVRMRKLLAPPLKLDRSRLALRLLLNQLERQKGNVGRILAGDEDGGSDKSSEALFPDTGPHTNATHSISRETVLAPRPHKKSTILELTDTTLHQNFSVLFVWLYVGSKRCGCGNSHPASAATFLCWVARQPFVGGSGWQRHCTRSWCHHPSRGPWLC